jgi:hypothetical protein
MKSELLKNMIESIGRQKPIPLTSICGHIGDEIIEFKIYGETSGVFGFINQSVLKICGQLIVGFEECVEDPAISGIYTLTINFSIFSRIWGRKIVILKYIQLKRFASNKLTLQLLFDYFLLNIFPKFVRQ